MNKKLFFLGSLLLGAIAASLFWGLSKNGGSNTNSTLDETPAKGGINQPAGIQGGLKFFGSTSLGDTKELHYGIYDSQENVFSLLALPQQDSYLRTSGSSRFLDIRENGKLLLFNVLTGEKKTIPLPFLLRDNQHSHFLASETEDNKFLIQIDDTVPADGLVSFEVVRSQVYIYDTLSEKVRVVPSTMVNKRRAFSFVNCKKYDSLLRRVLYWYCFEGTGSSAPVSSENLETGKEEIILADTSKNTPSHQDFEKVFSHEDRFIKLSTAYSPRKLSFFSLHGERAELVLPEELTLPEKRFFEADFLPQYHTLATITDGGTLTLIRYDEENKSIVEIKDFQSSYGYGYPYPEFYLSDNLVYWFWNDTGDLRVINIQNFSLIAELTTPLKGEVKAVILK